MANFFVSCGLVGLVAIAGGTLAAFGPHTFAQGPFIILESTPSQFRAVSGDGTVAVGVMTGAGCGQAVRWTAQTGAQFLPRPAGSRCSAATSVDFYGRRSAGNIVGDGQPAAYWDGADSLPVILGDLPLGGNSAASQCISGDGSVIFGAGRPAVGVETWRWTAATGMVSLGDLPGGRTNTTPFGVSFDGTIVAGLGFAASGSVMFRWTQETGLENLGPVPGSGGSAGFGLSADGSTIVGCAVSGDARSEYPVLWRRQSGYVRLPYPTAAFRGSATSANFDGSIIGGEVLMLNANGRGIDRAVLWVQGRPPRYFADVLTEDLGIDLGTFRPATISGISEDGTVVVGYGVYVDEQSTYRTSHGFIAYLPRQCRADVDNNGGVDGGDVEAFFALWDDGLQEADFDQNGGVDGADIAAFFNRWRDGC